MQSVLGHFHDLLLESPLLHAVTPGVHFCIWFNFRKHMFLVSKSGITSENKHSAQVILLTKDLECKWWKNIIAANSTEKHLLAAIKSKVLICQSLHAKRISHPCLHLTSQKQISETVRHSETTFQSQFMMQCESFSIFWHANMALSKLSADPFGDLGGLPKYLP